MNYILVAIATATLVASSINIINYIRINRLTKKKQREIREQAMHIRILRLESTVREMREAIGMDTGEQFFSIRRRNDR